MSRPLRKPRASHFDTTNHNGHRALPSGTFKRSEEFAPRQCTYNVRNMEGRSCNRCYSGKAISVPYSECVSVALGIQHVMRMRRIILSSVACLAVQYFSTLFHKRQDFRRKKKSY